MNEQFLSKAKSEFDEIFVEGHYYTQYIKINSRADNLIRIHHIIPTDGMNEPIEIDVNTLCQCTGIRDKDKKFAFNGDLFWDEDMYMRIFWIEGEFFVIWNDGPQPVEDWIKLTSNYMIDKVIVGNIHDDKCMVI